MPRISDTRDKRRKKVRAYCKDILGLLNLYDISVQIAIKIYSQMSVTIGDACCSRL